MFSLFGKSELHSEELVVIQMVTDAFEEFRKYAGLDPRFLLRGIQIRRKERKGYSHGRRDVNIDYSIRGCVLFGDTLIRFSTRVFGRPETKLYLDTSIQLRAAGAYLGSIYPRPWNRGGVSVWGMGERIYFQPRDQEYDIPEEEQDKFPDVLARLVALPQNCANPAG